MITTKKAGVEKLSVTYNGSLRPQCIARYADTESVWTGLGWELRKWFLIARLDESVYMNEGSTRLNTPMTKPLFLC